MGTGSVSAQGESPGQLATLGQEGQRGESAEANDFGGLIAQWTNGGYEVSIHRDGTKIRRTIDENDPPVLPEQMDLKITDWCDAGCAWCHERSTTKGAHGDLDAALELLRPLHPGSEIAIGGGDPLSHPDFERFVRGLRSMGLVPSVTVNGRHLERHLPMLERLTSEGQLFGVGVSYSKEHGLPLWNYPHMVLHLIAGIDPPSVLDEATERMKILLLGYKRFGRGQKLFEIRRPEVESNLRAWYRELFIVARKHHLSFDNLAIEQLKPSRLFADPKAYERQYMGEEGLFSMYVDAVTQTFSLSSYSETRHPWSSMPAMFATIRKSQGFQAAHPATRSTPQGRKSP
jgi:hypothetical protein